MKGANLLEQGYIHQDSCPNGAFEDHETDSSLSDDDDESVREPRSGFQCCADRRCTTWFDLRSWFGYLSTDLPSADFQACFTDVAHGGIGLFEKLVVLGGKTLETFAEIHFYEQWASSARPYVPRELAEAVGEDAPRLLWAQKRVERTTTAQALYAFGKSYLSTAQDLPTRQAVAKYVKACAGFACQSTDTENLYKWMPILVEHVYWIQRVRTEADTNANNLLQDLQEYLGYRHDQLLPRIRECLRNRLVPQRSDTPTGKELIRLYAADYFGVLAQEGGIEKKSQAVWIDEELDMFMEGPAIPLFSVLVMSLQPFLMTNDSQELPAADTFVATFYSLVAACWVLSTEDRVKIWMPALIQRLRQIQLLAQLSNFEGNVYTRAMRRRRLASQPVDLAQAAGANNGARDLFRLWSVDHKRRPAGEPAEDNNSPRLLQLGGPKAAERTGGPLSSVWSAVRGLGGRAAESADAAKSRPCLEQTLPSDKTLFLTDVAPAAGEGKASQTLVLLPFARVVPPPRRRPAPGPQQEAPAAAPSQCYLFSCGSSAPPCVPPAPTSFAWSSPCRASASNGELLSSVGASSAALNRRQESVESSQLGSFCASEGPDRRAVRERKKPTTVKICLDEAGSGQPAVLRAFSGVSASALSAGDVHRERSREKREDGRESEVREPDARAILVGENMKPVCLNFSKDASEARVYVTDLDEDEKAALGVASEASPEKKTPDRSLVDPRLQCQQMQLELQQMQLEQLQLQQEIQREALLQARPVPLFAPPASPAPRSERTIPCQVPISVRVELPADALKKALGPDPDRASELGTDRPSRQVSGSLLITPQPGGDRRLAPPMPFCGGAKPFQMAPRPLPGSAAGSAPSKPLPKPVGILAYAMPRPAPAPVRYDGARFAFLPMAQPAHIAPPKPAAPYPLEVTLQVPNLLCQQRTSTDRQRGCNWNACLPEPLGGKEDSAWSCWPEQARLSSNESRVGNSALFCADKAPGGDLKRQFGPAPPQGLVPPPPSAQARVRDGPVFNRQRTNKL
ncbi:Apicomplexan specific protein, related [Neospora caninum Liverpool]|uniref:Apicomplexan specific protein, related n=1 Tax=Neospora caninum (strain Liverpool) TaxID=572307 RepID=F0VK41_NEOCL|nr:Apicomplexan specific protein, related [Neospora caninum Liverpool]CBZ54442.1 Apicomplexan specific protein, related [Neospora caninum Liverpool]CEL69152.1 TPA: Apicomplexan specific protein, related [Neospora caninum Liverpool]|eukprot:XP_003884472.1 Apicomplexan specific protein, related [Neospora caninum Liverpool]